MSTANKLSYLNDTKSLLRTSLNKFGSNIITTDTFRSYDTKLNEIYDKLPKVTATGQGLTISNVQNGLLDDFKMNGVDLEQDTTTGKNLLNISDITSGNGIKNNNNKSITLNGNITSTSFTLTNPIILKANATYIMSLTNNDTNAGDSTFILRNGNTNKMSIYFKNLVSNAPFTPTEDIIIDTLRIYNSGVTFNNYTFSIQLEEGSTSTDYEPYTGGIASPNPDYPQDIKVVEGRQVITDKGKNLFDKNNANILTGFLADGGTFNPTTGYKTLYISCNNSSTYTIQKTSGSFFRVAEFENIPANGDNWITRTKDDNANVITFTTTTGNYLAVTYFRSSDTVTEQEMLNSIQIEEGSTATNYEPYYEPVSYNINLHGKNEFDGEYEDGYYNMNGTKPSTQDPYGRRSTNLNKIEPNTNYSISINNNIISETIRLFYYDASRKFISTKSISNGTFTSPAECYYVSWHSSSLKQNYPDGIPNMMIEQGQTITTYEDYYDYKLAKIPNTDYKNRIYKNNGNWYFEENVKKIVLDGSEKITIQNIGTANWYYQLSVNCYKTEQLKQMCSHYKNSGIYDSNTYQGIMMLTEGNFVRIRYGEEDTVDNFKMWLSNNNVELWYPLINFITTQITNTTLIDQLEAISVHTGTNIITISNDNNIIPEIEITRLKELEKLA